MGIAVISRRFLSFLVYGLPVLVVSFGVLMGANALARAAGDATGSILLWRIALACLLLLIVDILLLVGVLGLETLSGARRNDEE